MRKERSDAAEADEHFERSIAEKLAIADDAGGRREWLRFSEDSYQLGPLEWLDLDAFNRLVKCAEEAEMVGRLDLARGRYAHALRFCPHGEVCVEDRYAAWAEPTLSSLTRTVQRVRERLVELCLELGTLEEAIRQAEEMVLHDPAEENGYRLLIRAHLARDDRSTPLLVFRRCQTQLAEYGGPSAGLLALF
ncbi:MAG TPA: bacterial transcriptional activator domain-containing protein [Chloroflexota bacterium]|nr:bacterial transcriptional activator domain-containing protein [Chloroflexota bacterium]